MEYFLLNKFAKFFQIIHIPCVFFLRACEFYNKCIIMPMEIRTIAVTEDGLVLGCRPLGVV